MFLGMNPPLSVSFDPAHSVFNMACVCVVPNWSGKNSGFASLRAELRRSPLWVRELALGVLLYTFRWMLEFDNSSVKKKKCLSAALQTS